jgi:hypothetical protein
VKSEEEGVRAAWREAEGDGGSFFSFLSFVWSVLFISLNGNPNQTNQMNQRDWGKHNRNAPSLGRFGYVLSVNHVIDRPCHGLTTRWPRRFC